MARSKATARMPKKNKVAKASKLEAGEILSPDAAKSWKSWQSKKKRQASRDAKKAHKIENVSIIVPEVAEQNEPAM
jgi:hypothetical protein